MFFRHKTPVRYPILFPRAIKRVRNAYKCLYLSFDDGPHPETTYRILDLLASFDSKAMFFCTGMQAEKHPEILKLIIDEGHSVGNHSYSHKNAFKVPADEWLEDVLRKSPVSESEFFRPPYGKMKIGLYRKLLKKYRIVLWDVLSMDFDDSFDAEMVFEIVKKYSRQGSVVVFHDNPSFIEKTLVALEKVLEWYTKIGFGFKSMSNL